MQLVPGALFFGALALAAAAAPQAPIGREAPAERAEVRGLLETVLGASWGQPIADAAMAVSKRAKVEGRTKHQFAVSIPQFGVDGCKLTYAFNENGFFRCGLVVPVQDPAALAATYSRVHAELTSRLVSEDHWEYYKRRSSNAPVPVTVGTWPTFAKHLASNVGYFAGSWFQANALVLATTEAPTTKAEGASIRVTAEWFGRTAAVPTKPVEDLYPEGK